MFNEDQVEYETVVQRTLATDRFRSSDNRRKSFVHILHDREDGGEI